MTRWLYPGELERPREQDRFDPIVEGARHGLPGELSAALWERVCAEATDGAGRSAVEQARRRFRELAARAARGERLHLEPGRLTRVGIEGDGAARAAYARHPWVCDRLRWRPELAERRHGGRPAYPQVGHEGSDDRVLLGRIEGLERSERGAEHLDQRGTSGTADSGPHGAVPPEAAPPPLSEPGNVASSLIWSILIGRCISVPVHSAVPLLRTDDEVERQPPASQAQRPAGRCRERRNTVLVVAQRSSRLGWENKDDVEHAVRSVELAATHRAALVLLAETDFVPIALALHRVTRGASAPFVLCDPLLRDTPPSPRRCSGCSETRSQAWTSRAVFTPRICGSTSKPWGWQRSLRRLRM
jgi:hypothetical protein